MFAIIGASGALLGLLLSLSAAVVVIVKVVRLRDRVAALPSHPVFEPEWRERQALTVHNLAVNLQTLNVELQELTASLARIVVALESLDAVRRVTARATEDALGQAVPWLRSLFAKKS